MNKSFNKPHEYAAVLNRLADRNLFAITSFIIGMDNDGPGVADRILERLGSWPAGLPVFGQLTPFPATPLYDRLLKAGRLTRPKHWLDFAPYQMAHTPLKMSIAQAQQELQHAWESSYSPERNRQAIDSMSDKSVGWQILSFHHATVVPRDLLPADGTCFVAKSVEPKSRNDLQAHEGLSGCHFV